MSSLAKCITVFVSGACNLDCVYCYAQDNKSNKTISMPFVKAAFNKFYGSDPIGLRLFGVGEPTTAFSKMKSIVEYAKSVSKTPIDIELQSNGYFSDVVANWINKNINILWLSCDGPPEIHDVYRPTKNGNPSSNVIIRNIKRFARSKSCTLGVRTTVTSETCSRQKEIVEFFHSLGIKYISADPLFLPVGHNQGKGGSFPMNLLISDPEEYGKHFVEAHRKALELGISYNSILTVNAGTDSRFGCQGCYTNPHLTVDGAVTCCDMAFRGDTPLRDMVWGEFDEGTGVIRCFGDVRKKSFQRKIGNIPECKGCEWESECCGGCFGEALNETGNARAIKPFSCKATKYILPRIDRSRMSRLGHP